MKFYTLLFLTMLALTSGAQEKCIISCPIETTALKKAKVKRIDITRENDSANTKELTNTFYIDKKGCPEKEIYLQVNEGRNKWMKKEIRKSPDAEEIIFTLSEINADSTENILEKTTETYNKKKQLIKRISETYSKKKEVKTETFDPLHPEHENYISYTFSRKDTLQIESTIQNSSQKIYSLKIKQTGFWYESEKAITHYTNGMETDYKSYKNGMLISSREGNSGQNTGSKTNPNDVAPNTKTAVVDTLYSADPKSPELVSKPSKNTYMILRFHSDYEPNKIVTEQIYYPNGLLYSHHNLVEKEKSVCTYTY